MYVPGRGIAVASQRFELVTVHDLNGAPAVLDKLLPLQLGRCRYDRHSFGAE